MLEQLEQLGGLRMTADRDVPDEVTPEVLDRLEALLNGAAPGPWMVGSSADDNGQRFGTVYDPDDPTEPGVLIGDGHAPSVDLLVAAVNALPALIAAARRALPAEASSPVTRDEVLTEVERVAMGDAVGYVHGSKRALSRVMAEVLVKVVGRLADQRRADGEALEAAERVLTSLRQGTSNLFIAEDADGMECVWARSDSVDRPECIGATDDAGTGAITAWLLAMLAHPTVTRPDSGEPAAHDVKTCERCTMPTFPDSGDAAASLWCAACRGAGYVETDSERRRINCVSCRGTGDAAAGTGDGGAA